MKTAILIPLLSACLFVTGCVSSTGDDSVSSALKISSSEEKETFTYEKYLNDLEYVDGDLEFSFTKVSEVEDHTLGILSYDISFNLLIKNNTDTSVSFPIENPVIYNETNKESAKKFAELTVAVPANGTSTNAISASLRTSIKKELYSLRFEYNSKTVCYHFYDK